MKSLQNTIDYVYEKVKVLERVFEKSVYSKVVMDRDTKIYAINSVGRKIFEIDENGKTNGKIKSRFLSDYLNKTSVTRLNVLLNELNSNEFLTRTIKLDINNKSYYFDVTATANIYDNFHFFTFQDVTKKVLEIESRNQFIAIAGHEIKTPLAVSIAYSDLLKRRYKDDNVALKYIEKIQEKNKLLQNYIEAIVDEIRIGTGKMYFDDKKQNVEKVLKASVKELRKMYPEREIKLISKLGDKDVLIDKTRLTQVIDNLVSNAVKHSSKKKPIIINLKNTEKGVLISVRDFGKGISLKEQSDIFKAFYRTNYSDRQGPGLGLGLYISSKIVDRYGSKLSVHSRRGKGANFYFELPLDSY